MHWTKYMRAKKSLRNNSHNQNVSYYYDQRNWRMAKGKRIISNVLDLKITSVPKVSNLKNKWLTISKDKTRYDN